MGALLSHVCWNKKSRTHTMKSLWQILFVVAAALTLCCADDCNKILPDNSTCPEGKGPYMYPDADHCSRFWQCDNGCVTHMLCEKDYLYDDKREWCMHQRRHRNSSRTLR